MNFLSTHLRLKFFRRRLEAEGIVDKAIAIQELKSILSCIITTEENELRSLSKAVTINLINQIHSENGVLAIILMLDILKLERQLGKVHSFSLVIHGSLDAISQNLNILENLMVKSSSIPKITKTLELIRTCLKSSSSSQVCSIILLFLLKFFSLNSH
jgi:hypothetical protein